jgi:hypothetical protein
MENLLLVPSGIAVLDVLKKAKCTGICILIIVGKYSQQLVNGIDNYFSPFTNVNPKKWLSPVIHQVAKPKSVQE